MLTLQKTRTTTIASLPINGRPVEDLLTKEWLLTNNRGGYASSTIIGCNTRKYHGLLIGSLNPPVNRIMALANCLEMIIVKGQVFNLSTFEFNEKFAPDGFAFIKQFRQDVGVHFDYQCDKLKLTKSVYLLHDTDTVVLLYDFTKVKEPAELVLRPFIGLRDFHTLQRSYASLHSSHLHGGLLVRHNVPGSCELFLSCPSANFEKDEQWWFDFAYRADRERGQDFSEDLWTPGFFKARINSPAKIVLWANLRQADDGEQAIRNLEIHRVIEQLQKHQKGIKRNAESRKRDRQYELLCLAAEQFTVTRNPEPQSPDMGQRATSHKPRVTILAGFPWFADWGRDAFISLPGLLLLTGRFDEAKSVLTTFAQAAEEGVIPNRFDDRGDTAYFNSVDASLWFINAAFQYLNTAGDCETFERNLLPTIRRIIDSYQKGNRFGICADEDGLITAGGEQTQLTWMDAKYEGVVFTPRYGKAVEVNALWYNALCRLAEFYTERDTESAKHYRSMADKVAAGFCSRFWNETAGYLNDCILPDGSIDDSLRPNQIFAVSLPFSPLSAQQQAAVVNAVQKELLTPYGLRTLAAADTRYKGTYTGPQRQRDEAYHQGTVWPYLIGPFVEAYLKVNNFSQKSKTEAAQFIQPLLRHLTDDGCLGQICEILDGNSPHRPKGCFAQAWSVAELIRAYQLINR